MAEPPSPRVCISIASFTLVLVQKRHFSAISVSIYGFSGPANKEYASAQTLDFLNLARESLVSESTTTPPPPEFLDGNTLDNSE